MIGLSREMSTSVPGVFNPALLYGSPLGMMRFGHERWLSSGIFVCGERVDSAGWKDDEGFAWGDCLFSDERGELGGSRGDGFAWEASAE